MIGGMRALLKFVLVIVVLGGVAFGIAWFWAGRSAGPTIEIREPGRFIGQASTLTAMFEAPDGEFSAIDIALEQSGKTFPVFSLDQREPSTVARDTADQMLVARPIGKRAIPDLQAGPARIVVRASRPVLYGLRHIESTAVRDVQVRLEQPRVAVLSTFHYIRRGEYLAA